MPESQNVFKDHPQRYPKARQKATAVVNQILEMTRKGPRSIPAIIADTSFQLTMGYVLCTTASGLVEVVSVPYGEVVTGMRIMCRQIGGQGTNRRYVFDGYAPNLSGLGLDSGSIMYTSTVITPPQVLAISTATGFPSIAGLSSSTGYYWHLFFYLAKLPAAKATVWQLSQNGGSNVLTLEYLPTGLLRFISQDGHGYITTAPVEPHNSHWVVLQPGLTSGNEFFIDGLSFYTGIIGGTDEPTFSGNGANYQGSLLSNTDGTQSCPIGSWVSKIGFGANYSSGAIALSVETNVPDSDTLLPNFNSGSTQKTQNLYLCEDTPGASTSINSAVTSAGSALTITTVSASVLAA